jgi:molybdopterin adenylyltransferase
MTIRFAIVTVSDRSYQGTREDLSGPALVEEIKSQGWAVIKTLLIPDEVEEIEGALLELSERPLNIDIILTTGGTGFSPRDVTPEATLAVVQRSAPGLSEAMRAASLKVTPHAMLSRAAAGIRNRTLVVNLPGSPKAALENFHIIQPVLQHAIDLLHEDPDAESGHRFAQPENNTTNM